ncbi:MAG: sulfotransferase [Candidatus Andeanibacterium colombiense]|uniref:Sulfotransferase n=1 Tax=Candidatus Andeanibacterium colombiense TaxID=3121345 RepID=A0AAJ5X8M7_9SPHN|nr:MAG: sulfotransferase [Sphingomonadaceae bacterium]
MSPPPTDREPVGQKFAALTLTDRFQRAIRRGSRSEMVENLRGLIELRAPMAEQWLQMAMIAIEIGAVVLALQAVDLYLDDFDWHPAALFRKVKVLAQVGAYSDAFALVCSLPQDLPDRFSHALIRGAAALNVGEAGEARQWLEEATRLRPESGEAWHSLSQLVDFGDEPELYARLSAARSALQGQPAAEGALYCYALGKAHADNHDYARAFAAFEYAAGETRALFPNDRVRERQLALEAVRGYDAARIDALAARQDAPTGRAIFVMGLPRSGTTLVEQILASHSAVNDGGEIDRLRLLVHEAGGASFPALDAYVRRSGSAPLARLWTGLLAERFPGGGRVIDKTTNNSRALGLAAAILPEAPLIWLRRDPLDNAWSCFRTCFMGGIRWSNDLADIAYNFRLEDELLARWQEILGERLLVVSYEGLASEPEPWIRRIVAHCGLAEEPAVFAPHENRRAVATASVMQVRRPINRAGIGAAEPYREFLGPFIDAYYV